LSAKRIQSIRHGIVFLMAEWSVGVRWAHGQLTRFLKEHDVSPDRLITIDVDEDPGLYDLPELAGRIHGWGETAVVKDGRIVFLTVLGKDKGRIQEHCEELLRAYEN
jgi:hypothetical protein